MSLFPEYEPATPSPVAFKVGDKKLTFIKKPIRLPCHARSKMFSYMGFVLMLSDGNSIQEYPLYQRSSNKSGLFLLKADHKSATYEDINNETPAIREVVQQAYASQYAKLHDIPLNGETLLFGLL